MMDIGPRTPHRARLTAPVRAELYISSRTKVLCQPQDIQCGDEVVIRKRHLRLARVAENEGLVYLPAKHVEVKE